MKYGKLPTTESELIQIIWEEFTDGYLKGLFTGIFGIGIMFGLAVKAYC